MDVGCRERRLLAEEFLSGGDRWDSVGEGGLQFFVRGTPVLCVGGNLLGVAYYWAENKITDTSQFFSNR